ncbi:MAG: hypothetical protein V3W52_09740 [Syntrophobacteria bacterium]
MNCCGETVKMAVPPGNRPALPRDWIRGVPKRYVAGSDTRGRPEGRPYPRSQQVIHEIFGLKVLECWNYTIADCRFHIIALELDSWASQPMGI